MSVQELLEDALARKRDGLLRRWAHYECLKDKLQEMGLTLEEYQSAVKKIADSGRKEHCV